MKKQIKDTQNIKSNQFLTKPQHYPAKKNPVELDSSFQGSTKEIRKLDKSERVIAIHDFIEQLASEFTGNNISTIVANVDEKYQNKCDEITEKAILQLEERILKGIDQLNDKEISETARSKLLAKVLEQHVVYENLRRERSKFEGKSKLEETLENKDNDWISKLLKKLGGLADDTAFQKKGRNHSSHQDLLNKSYLSDSGWKQEKNRKIGGHHNSTTFGNRKQKFIQVETDSNSNDESKTLKLIKKQSLKEESQEGSVQSYKEINQKLQFLTEELREQSLLIKDLMEQRRSQQMIESRKSELRSRVTKKSVEIPEQDFCKFKENRNRVSIQMGEGSGSQTQLPFGIKRAQNAPTLKYSGSQQQLNGGYPPEININIRIMPY